MSIKNIINNKLVLDIILLFVAVTVGSTGCAALAMAHDGEIHTSLPIAQVTATSTPVVSDRKADRIQKAQEVKTRLEQARETYKERIKTERETFKTKVKTIKDERKQTKAVSLEEAMATANSRRTTAYVHHLEKLTSLLQRVEDRTDKVAASGVDVATVRAKITEAETALAQARTKVEAQQQKVYAVEINDESKLGQNFKTTLQQVRQDHAAVRAEIKAAHQAIRAAFTSLKAVTQASPSPTP